MGKKLILRILAALEKLLLKVPVKTSLPVVFITGAPRSGTTITYQYFIELGKFCYFTNTERKYCKFPIVSAMIYRGANKSEPTHENYYGRIPGKHSPSDGWEIFHRWFPYYYDPDQPCKKAAKKELHRTVAWFQIIYRKPFIVKNNANSLRMNELRDIFPNAIFVHVERDEAEAKASIVKGMQENKIVKAGLWGTGPRIDLIPTSVRTFEQKAAYQLKYIANYISNQHGLIKIHFDRTRQQELRQRVKDVINSIHI